MLYQLGDTAPRLDDDTPWVAPSASVMGNIRLRTNSSVWFGAILRGDNDLIDIGENSNVQDGSVLHTDPGSPISLGRDVTIGHNVTLHGATIEDTVLIGMGSTILNRAVIRSGSIVGAGALITEDKEFPPNSLIVGSPAKAIRTLDDQAVAMIKQSASIYVANAKRFRTDLKAL